MRAVDRVVDWERDDTSTVLAKVWAADGRPGVPDSATTGEVRLFGAHLETRLTGHPGQLVAWQHGAVCRATSDGAVWITHAAQPGGVKRPAAAVLASELGDTPQLRGDWSEIAYSEEGEVGFLAFDFYNGAMGTGQTERLLAAVRHARSRPTRVLVLLGGSDFFSNGIDLTEAHAAVDPGAASFRNLRAINAVVREIVGMTDKLTVAALRGDAAAGGAMLALAADRVEARGGAILNPHYQTMGLYGSEYWTYLLPRRVGVGRAAELASECAPMGMRQAVRDGLVDDAWSTIDGEFMERVHASAHAIAQDPLYARRLAAKRAELSVVESRRPLASYEAAELARMRECFAPGAYYHAARAAFFGAPAAPLPERGPWEVDEAQLGAAGASAPVAA